MSILPDINSPDKLNKAIPAASASWSLAANSRQHKRVMSMCMSARQKHPEWKSELSKIILQAQTPNAKSGYDALQGK